MPAVTVEDVRHVALLARLGLTEQQAQELTRDLNTILEHMDVLARVNTKSAEQGSSANDAAMRLRADHGPPIPLGEPPESFGSAMRDGFFVVPRLSTHEDPA